MENPWLLPEGVEEILPTEASHIEGLRRRILDIFRLWGYDFVITPPVEYLDSLLVGTGQDLRLQTFTLTDQLTGHLMGVRADMTPQVSRIDAHSLLREGISRLCYQGTVLHTKPDAFGVGRSPIQVGAECFGHAGIESDVEILCLADEVLRAAGVQNPTLDLGHVGVFQSLMKVCELTPQQEKTFLDALQRKAKTELTAALEHYSLAKPVKALLSELPNFHGGLEVLEAARQQIKALGSVSQGLLNALDELEAIAAASEERLEARLYFDLAELRGYHYHTGMVFNAYAPGYGQAIARGGRYDAIGEHFGRARPATGFSTDLNTLAALSEVQALPHEGILAPYVNEPQFFEEVARLRAEGQRVVVVYENPEEGAAKAQRCNRLLQKNGSEWLVYSIR